MQKLLPLLFLICQVYRTLGYSCVVKSPNPVQLGNTSVVCVHFQFVSQANSSDIISETYAFTTTVDDFAAFSVAGMAKKIKGYGSTMKVNAAVQFQNSNKASSMVIFDPSQDGGIYRSVLSFVVEIIKGNFTNITLDNADCSTCETSSNKQVCSSKYNKQCFDLGKNYEGEEVKFFISWIGTDLKNSHLLSYTKRLSRFSQYSIGSIYQAAKSLVS